MIAENEDASPWKIDIQSHQGCDDVDMFVPTSDSKAKRYCCFYCLKRVAKLVRHLETVHKSEPDVKIFRGLPIGNFHF